MGIPGIDPNDPRPANRRYYVPGAGGALGASSSLPYLLFGNITSSGTETVDSISDTPVADDADCIARCGARSELYAMYRQIRSIDQDGLIYLAPVAESAGVASNVLFTVAGASAADGTWVITVNGVDYTASVKNGDNQQTVATAIGAALSAADQGRAQVTNVVAIVGAGPSYGITVAAAQKGPRGDQTIGNGATRGIRTRWVGGPGQTQTVTKGALTSGTTEDSYANQIANLEGALNKGRGYYLVVAKTSTTAPTTTDAGLGQLLAEVIRLRGPSLGIDCQVVYATVDTVTNAQTVATASTMNDWATQGFQSKNNDWTTAMIAAHMAAQIRVAPVVIGPQTGGQVSYPAARLNGIPLPAMPKPYVTSDNPSSSDEVNALNNGVSLIKYAGSTMRLIRHISNRSLNAQGAQDYRTREGHIARCLHFGWEQFYAALLEEEQPNADSDPPDGSPPPALTMTPSMIKSIHDRFIDEMTGSRPFGKYPGPIFKPSARDIMKSNFVCTYDGGGGFSLTVDWRVVEHKLKSGTTVLQVGQGY